MLLLTAFAVTVTTVIIIGATGAAAAATSSSKIITTIFLLILMLLFLLIYITVTDSRAQNASSIYLVEPRNTAVVQGELAIFNCSYYTNRTGEVLYWRKYEGADDDTGSNILYVEEGWSPTIVDTNYTAVDQMNLGIPNATSSYVVAPDGDYILYVCWLVQEDSIQRQAHLIVLGESQVIGGCTVLGRSHGAAHSVQWTINLEGLS